MTRTANDRFAKQHLEELLRLVGQVETSRDVAGETREIDVWFTPNPDAAGTLPYLGVLGQMVSCTCAIEPFRNPVQPEHVETCISKLFDLTAELRRKAKRDRFRLAKTALPHLWILTPTVSEAVRSGFAATTQPDWVGGIYFLPTLFRTRIVALHQLPATPDTLWLRLMGRGTVQAGAIAELLALPSRHPLKAEVMEHIAALQITLQVRQNLSKAERELAMNLTPAYLKWREETLAEGWQGGRQVGQQEGRQEGRQEEGRGIVLRLLDRRFGELSPEVRSRINSLSLEQLESLAEALLEFSSMADLSNWLDQLEQAE